MLKRTAFGLKTHLNEVIREFEKETDILQGSEKLLAEQTKIALQKFSDELVAFAENFKDN